MVLIYLKQSEDTQFLFECFASQSVDIVVRELVEIHNLQLRILRLVQEGEQLRLFGPSMPPCSHGNGEGSDDGEQECNEKLYGSFYRKDPSMNRSGHACDPEVAEILRKMLAEAEICASKGQVLHKIPLTTGLLKEALENVRQAVMMCFPMGLPQSDLVHQLLVGTYKDEGMLDPDTAQMWWADKQLMRQKKLSDHVGKNEKTKIVAKLQARGCPPLPQESKQIPAAP